MANKTVVECVDLLLCQICNKDEPFRGKPFIGVGDFRQVAPVVKGAGRSSTIDASIKTSYLWKYFNLHVLNQPICNASDPIFAEFIDAIGENWQEHEVTLDIFKTTHDIEEAISFLYSANSISNLVTLQRKAFHSPRNILVDDFNYKILNILPGTTYTYLSNDVIKENNDTLNDHPFATSDYLANLTYSGIPNHELKLKVGAICSIMQNISINKGLENIGSIIVWAIGTYPVEQDNNDIELVMFVPIDPNDRDPDNCAVFEKNEYYAVSEKIMPEYYRGTKRLK
ncbi:13021_t:CDS:2, partial [Cetraspora pellucida]